MASSLITRSLDHETSLLLSRLRIFFRILNSRMKTLLQSFRAVSPFSFSLLSTWFREGRIFFARSPQTQYENKKSSGGVPVTSSLAYPEYFVALTSPDLVHSRETVFFIVSPNSSISSFASVKVTSRNNLSFIFMVDLLLNDKKKVRFCWWLFFSPLLAAQHMLLTCSRQPGEVPTSMPAP